MSPRFEDRSFDWRRPIAQWGPDYASVAAVARGYSGSGTLLPADLGDYLSRSLGADVSRVRVHCDETSAQLTQRLGTAAFACGERLYFHPSRYQPDSHATLALLGHELAHTIQQRGGVSRSSRVDLGQLFQLEKEANAAAAAVLAGRSIAIEPQANSPELLPAIPLIVWGLVAAVGAAAATYGITSSSETIQQDIAQDRSSPEKHTHEKFQYAIIPFVGSLDQMMNGRSAASRAIGAAFLVSDMFTLGAAKAVIVAFNSVGRKAITRGLAKAGGKELDTAAEQLLKAGAQFVTKEEGAKQITKLLANKSGKPFIITAAEGFQNHAVTYIIDPRKNSIWRIHGGPSALFFRNSGKQALSKMPDFATKLVSKSNHISIYTKSMMKKGGPQEAIKFFEKAQASNAVTNFLKAPGCGGTQALLLSKAGINAGGTGSRILAPVFPIQMLKTQGQHMILNPTFARFGTGLQAAVWSAPHVYAKGGQAFNNDNRYDEAMAELRNQKGASLRGQGLGGNGSPLSAGALTQGLNGSTAGLLGHSGFGYNIAAYEQDPSNLLDLNAFMQDEDDTSGMTIEEISEEEFAAAMSQGLETVTSEWTMDGQKDLHFPK